MVKPVTPAEAAATLDKCGAPKTDADSNRIKAKMTSQAVNEGLTGAEIAALALVPTSVGQCVADSYDVSKKPGIMDRATNAITDLANQFTRVSNAVVGTVVKEIEVNAPVVVNTVTAGAITNIQKGNARVGFEK